MDLAIRVGEMIKSYRRSSKDKIVLCILALVEEAYQEGYEKGKEEANQDGLNCPYCGKEVIDNRCDIAKGM